MWYKSSTKPNWSQKDLLFRAMQKKLEQKVLDLLEASEEEVNKMTANITKTLQEEKEWIEKAQERRRKKKTVEIAKKMLKI